MKCFAFLAASALLLVACEGTAPPAQAGPVYPSLTGRVVDEAGLLTAAQERQLGQSLEAVEREVGPQFVVVTVQSLQGYPILEYGVGLGRHWRIGSRERNDGLILLVAPNERQVRIEVGYGLEKRVTDPFAARVIQERILPRFRAGDLDGGILVGSDALIERLRSNRSDPEIAREDGVVE